MSILQELRTGTPQLSVGTLTGSMMNQGEEIALLENSGIKLLHLDVMDGVAWPKLTVGAPFLGGLTTKLFKDVHLLVQNPENHVDDFAKAGADLITFQVEHTNDIAGTLKTICEAENVNDASRGILRGAALYPTTPLDTVLEHLDNIDVVFVLAIGPDTGKETFFDLVSERVTTLRAAKPELVIAVDGGVKKNNIKSIACMGPDLIVTGSAVFDGNDASQNITDMKTSIAAALQEA